MSRIDPAFVRAMWQGIIASPYHGKSNNFMFHQVGDISTAFRDGDQHVLCFRIDNSEQKYPLYKDAKPMTNEQLVQAAKRLGSGIASFECVTPFLMVELKRISEKKMTMYLAPLALLFMVPYFSGSAEYDEKTSRRLMPKPPTKESCMLYYPDPFFLIFECPADGSTATTALRVSYDGRQLGEPVAITLPVEEFLIPFDVKVDI